MPAKDALYFFVFFIDINPSRDATIWLSGGLKYLNLCLLVVNTFFHDKILLTDLQGRFKL